jgi:hypothetical protein
MCDASTGTYTYRNTTQLTEWGVTYDVYRMRCKWHMMYTEWGVTYDVYRMRCKWHMMYTEWGVSDIWCIQNEV